MSRDFFTIITASDWKLSRLPGAEFAILIMFSYLVKDNRKHFQLVVFLFVFAGTLGLCAMMSIMQPDEKAYRLYFVGLLAIISWCQIIGFTHRLFTLNAIGILCCHNIVAFANKLYINDPAVYVYSNMFFFVFISFGFYATKISEKFILDDHEHTLKMNLEKQTMTQKQNDLNELNQLKDKLLLTISKQAIEYFPWTNSPPLNGSSDHNFSGRAEIYNLLLQTTAIWSTKNSNLYPLNIETLNLRNCINNACDSLKNYGCDKGITLVNQVGSDRMVDFDKHAFDVAIRNLLSIVLTKSSSEKLIIKSIQLVNGLAIAIASQDMELQSFQETVSRESAYPPDFSTNFGLRVSTELITQHKGKLHQFGEDENISFVINLLSQ